MVMVIKHHKDYEAFEILDGSHFASLLHSELLGKKWILIDQKWFLLNSLLLKPLHKFIGKCVHLAGIPWYFVSIKASER